MLSGIQVRMARAALELGVRDLAKKAEINPNTVSRLETGGNINSANLEKIESVLKKSGIIFIEPDNNGGAGVRLKK